MSEIAVIGLGQGGSNLAQAIGAQFGIPQRVGIINLSAQDIGSVKGVQKDNILNITDTGAAGAGKNRQVGKDAFGSNMEKIATLAGKICKLEKGSVEYLFVAYSLAGGTGSGLGPIVTAYLSSEEVRNQVGSKVVIMGIPVLPDSSEGTIALTNACEALEEIHKFSVKGIASFAIVDNAFSKRPSIGDKYAEINARVATDLHRYLTTFGNSREGCLDARDRARGLGVPGLHSFIQLNDAGIPNGPFKIPEGSRVKLALCELPEGKSELFHASLIGLGVTKDDQITGFYDAENITPIIHLAGYNTATKISEEMRGHLALIKSRGLRQEAEDLSGKGFQDLASEKTFLTDQYAKKTAKGAQDLLEILG